MAVSNVSDYQVSAHITTASENTIKKQYFQTCCLCCSLRNGTLTIGIFTLLMINLSLFIESGVSTNKDIQNSTFSNFSDLEYDSEESLVNTGAEIIFLSVLEISSVLLIIGVLKKSSKFLWPWIVAYSLLFGAWAIHECLDFLFYKKSDEKDTYFFASFIFFALYVYFILIVYSFYKELKTIEKTEQETNANEML